MASGSKQKKNGKLIPRELADDDIKKVNIDFNMQS